MISAPVDLPFVDHVAYDPMLASLVERLERLSAEDAALERRSCALRLERGDVLGAILAGYGPECYAEAAARAGLSEQTAGQERWVSARIPDYARNPEALTWSAHREVAGLEPDQIDAVFAAALASGQTGQREIRELIRAMYGGDDPVVADPIEDDWPAFARKALAQHFGGRLSEVLISELVTQVERLRRDWERAQEQMIEAAF